MYFLQPTHLVCYMVHQQHDRNAPSALVEPLNLHHAELSDVSRQPDNAPQSPVWKSTPPIDFQLLWSVLRMSTTSQMPFVSSHNNSVSATGR